MTDENNKHIKIQNPFPGLRPFKMDESHLFFGREGQSEEILKKLAEEKFVAVIGASGSGKSSLIYCGLVPILYGGFIGNTNSKWTVITTRPGDSPIENLSFAIAEKSGNKKGEGDFLIKNKLDESTLRSSSNGLKEVLEQSFDFKNNNILLVIDQFEELFRYKSSKKGQSAYNESEAFVKLLVTANKETDIPLYIVLTMRSDFIGECSQFHELTERINESNYLVPQMTRNDFKSAIEGPVAVSNAEIDSQLVQQLLNEVGDNPDQLPILQHALMRTWDYWMEYSDIGQSIKIADYEAVGKMERALSEHANEAYDELNENEKWICESMFKTITEKGNDNRGIRHPTSIKQIASICKASVKDVIKVTEPFRAIGRSFITPSADIKLDKDSIIDLSHESLMRIWDKLKIWVEEEWEAVQMYMRLSEASEMYQLGKTSLWRPPDLHLALNWKEKQKPTLDWAKRYNPAFERTMVYLKTSDEDYKAEEANKVKLQKRQLRRTKIFAIILGTAAIVAVGLTLYSQSLKVQAEKQKQKAEKQKSIALEQKEEADKQKLIAEQQQNIALQQKEEADKQRQYAVVKEKEATRNFTIAEQQKQLALQREKEAREQRILALKNAEEAKRHSNEAEKARQEAYRRRMLSIAQSMAVKSQQISEKIQLKALVAYQAYLFNNQYNGIQHNPDIYLGLYSALRGLKGQNFNAMNGHTGSVMDVEFIPATNTIFTTGGDGKIIKWDTSNPDNEGEIIIENPFVQRDLEITPDGKMMFCATDEGKIISFNIKNSLKKDAELIGHQGIVSGLDISGNNKFIVSYGNDKTIRKWKIGDTKGQILTQTEAKINSLKISPDSKYMLAGMQTGNIHIWDINNPAKEIKILDNITQSAITSIAFNQSGKWLSIGNSRGEIIILDAENYQTIENLEGHSSKIYDIDFSADDKLLATASLDGTVRVWECNNLNNQPFEIKSHQSWVLSVAFSSDNKTLVSSGNQKERILVWPTKAEFFATEFKSLITRNMTIDEWNGFVGKDINYEKTIAEIE